ncbi:hypothetical protein CsSME_00006455 [Camellia sinensis var. sinensis]
MHYVMYLQAELLRLKTPHSGTGCHLFRALVMDWFSWMSLCNFSLWLKPLI